MTRSKQRFTNHKQRYALAKHHAWAGSLLLTILLTIRLFMEISQEIIDNTLFIVLGAIIMMYILVSLVYTYRFRTGLFEPGSTHQIKQKEDAGHSPLLNMKLEKQRLKLEKKKQKTQAKQIKKGTKRTDGNK